MKKQRLSSKLLAFLMSMLILLVSLPTYAFASLIDYSADENQTDVLENEENEASFDQGEVYVLEEDISLREENVKHFKLSDGTVKAVSYAQPVHYMDENGKWIDIDNALTLNGNEYSSKNKQEIKFANKSGSTGTVSIKDGEYKIDFTPLNVNKVSVEITNPQENNSRKFDDVKKLSNLVSYATYANIYDGIDLEYILVGNNIKENIIVKEKQSEYTYSFEIKLNKLNAELVNNAVILTDSTTGEQIYEIPAPYMLDASGEYSTDVEYTLTENGKWKYTLTVTASTEWINDKERQLPVTIDPTFIENENVTDLFVMDYDGVSENYPSLVVGNYVGNYDTLAFIKFYGSPTIPAATKLIDAKLVLQAIVYSGTNDEIKIGVYPADGDWTAHDVYGNYVVNHENRADYYDENDIVDYLTISNEGIYKWDITRLYKEWKAGVRTDHGVCLKDVNLPQNGNDDECLGHSIHFASSEAIERLLPMIELTYSSLKGIEDYYSYYTVDAGVGGTGYVNAYDGNLTMVVPITTTADEILPYSVCLIYDNRTGTWRNSFDETVFVENQGDITRYKWTDSDGTEHWFSPYFKYGVFGQKLWYNINSNGSEIGVMEPTEYYDEDGLGLTVKIIDGVVNMLDQKGNKKVFNSNGTLNYIEDTFGNVREFSYNSDGRVESVALTAKNKGMLLQLLFDYNDNGNLSSVFNSQTQVKAFIYWNGNNKVSSISYVSFFEGENFLQNAVYIYDDFEMLETVIDGNKGDKICFSYNYTVDSSVSNIVSLAGNNSLSDSYEISYEENKTVFKDLGNDPSISTDDVLTTYIFDSKGRVISTSTTDSTGNTVYGASSYTYYDKYEDAGVGPKIHNNVKNVISYGINAPNILINPDFVIKNTTLNGWQISGGSFATGETDGEYINPLKISRTSAGTTSIKQTLAYLENGKYTFSTYLNRYATNFDSLITLKVIDSQNQTVASESFQKYENETSELSSYWTREELRFEILESGSYTVIIEFVGTSASETLYIDNAMLEKGTGASTFSIYSDGEFGIGQKTLTSNINEAISYEQQINLPTLTSLEGWAISAWVKVDGSVASANSQYLNAGDGTNENYCSANVGIRVVSTSHEQFIPVDVDCRDWQYISAPLTYDSNLTCPPNDLFVYLVNEYNTGTVHFDKISVYRVGTSSHYTYNALGNVNKIENGKGQSTTYYYNGGNAIDVTSVESSTSLSTSNAYYDENHNLESVVTDYNTLEESLATLLTRNEQGQITKTYIANSEILDKCMVVDTVYITDITSSNYSKVDTVIDERGNETKYFYTENGLLKGVCLNNDEGTLYDYNVYGELIKVSLAKYNEETEALEYAQYNSDNVEYEYNPYHELVSIKTQSTEYNFSYDVYGNIDSITIGDNTLTPSELIELVSYEYEQNNGNLHSLNYGNGMSVQYLYDKLDRIIGICYNESTEQAVIYTYGSNGQVSAVHDVENSTVYNYYYSGDGTLTREKAKKNGVVLYERVYSYDNEGRLSGVDLYCLEDYSSPKNSISYTYDSDNRLVGITNGNGQSTSYTYNVFGQLTSKTSSYNSSFTLKSSYAYYTSGREDVAGISPVVNAEIRYINGVENGRISYTYDDRGNIVSIVDEDGYITSYEYDDKNQLIRENSERFNYTYLYQYDYSGNLLYKETRAYTTAPTSEVYSSSAPDWFEIFEYNDSVWGDRITGYRIISATNGQLLTSGNMTYDPIGNPLTYYNGSSYSFVWEEGRQLAGVTRGSNTIAYKYNQDGVRIEKTVGTLRYEYTVSGTRIEREKLFDGNVLIKDSYFYYDANGIASSAQIFVYENGVATEYNFILESNIQGDITNIYTADGTLVASLTYTAWGQIRVKYTISDWTLSDLAIDIPFKYRGYYHDQETGFYYLNSRYYDPYMMRFINADGYVSTGQGLNGNNMYAYCNNNPVMYVDPNGEFLIPTLLTIASSAVATGIFTTTTAVATGVAIGGTAVALSPITNIATVIKSNIEVKNSDVAAMSDEEFKKYKNESDSTAGMTDSEQIAYIRKVRETDSDIRSNWTEAQMLRELRYHEKGYDIITSINFSFYKKDEFTNQLNHVNFEPKQTFKTYARRIIANTFFMGL